VALDSREDFIIGRNHTLGRIEQHPWMTIHPEYRDFWAFFLNNNVKQVIVRRPGSIEVSQAEQEGDIGRNNMEFNDTQWCSYGSYS
jgi:hypothetical protein